MRTIVIGLGNPVRADDGVGPAVARHLRERLAGAEGVTVDELWAGGFRLAEAMVGYDRAILVDALQRGDRPPGSICRLSLSDLDGTRTTNCVHDASLPTALEAWRRLGVPLPRDISIWGIEAQDLESFSEELTTPVAEAVPRLVDAILQDLQLCKGA
jgi:hydrogenase maturation protease